MNDPVVKRLHVIARYPGLLLWMLLALPIIRPAMESVMVWHMGVQIPALVVAGVLLGPSTKRVYERYFASWNGHGVAGTLLALMTLLFWMLPRSLDASLDHGAMEVAKFVTLPLLVGLPLYHSWHGLSLIGRGIVWSNFIAMLFVMSWLYLAAPLRVCNNYLLNEQEALGWYFFGSGLAAVLFIGWRVLFGSGAPVTSTPHHDSHPDRYHLRLPSYHNHHKNA